VSGSCPHGLRLEPGPRTDPLVRPFPKVNGPFRSTAGRDKPCKGFPIGRRSTYRWPVGETTTGPPGTRPASANDTRRPSPRHGSRHHPSVASTPRRRRGDSSPTATTPPSPRTTTSTPTRRCRRRTPAATDSPVAANSCHRAPCAAAPSPPRPDHGGAVPHRPVAAWAGRRGAGGDRSPDRPGPHPSRLAGDHGVLPPSSSPPRCSPLWTSPNGACAP
jgi:hypothetical protein